MSTYCKILKEIFFSRMANSPSTKYTYASLDEISEEAKDIIKQQKEKINVLILGKAGVGKSTLLNRFAYNHTFTILNTQNKNISIFCKKSRNCFCNFAGIQ